jgi:hypothetical protein
MSPLVDSVGVGVIDICGQLAWLLKPIEPDFGLPIPG